MKYLPREVRTEWYIPPKRGRDSMGLLTPRDVPRAIAEWSEAHIQNHIDLSDYIRHGGGADSLAYIDAGAVGFIAAVV